MTNHFTKGPVTQWVSDNGLANNPFPNHLGGIGIPTLLVIIPGFCFSYDEIF